MRKIFRKYPESTLIALAAVFLAIILAYFTWGVGQVIGEANRAENGKGNSGGNPGFNIEGAQRLGFHGLVK